jgi:hypothetical protein
MNNEPTEFRHLPVGATFFIDLYPGNEYRKHGDNKAVFVNNRNGSQYNGCECILPSATLTRKQPLHFNAEDLLS